MTKRPPPRSLPGLPHRSLALITAPCNSLSICGFDVVTVIALLSVRVARDKASVEARTLGKRSSAFLGFAEIIHRAAADKWRPVQQTGKSEVRAMALDSPTPHPEAC